MLRSCIGVWIEVGGIGTNDVYRPTLAGLLAGLLSSRSGGSGGQASEFIEALLGYLRTALVRNPRFSRIESNAQKEAFGDDWEVPFMHGVLSVAHLTGGGASSGSPPTAFGYDLPDDIEDLIECSEIAEFVKLRVPFSLPW